MYRVSKQGVNDLTQIKEMTRMINASISAVSQNDSGQTLKILMLLLAHQFVNHVLKWEMKW